MTSVVTNAVENFSDDDDFDSLMEHVYEQCHAIDELDDAMMLMRRQDEEMVKMRVWANSMGMENFVE